MLEWLCSFFRGAGFGESNRSVVGGICVPVECGAVEAVFDLIQWMVVDAQAGFLRNGDVFSMWSDGISDHAGSSFVRKNAYESAEKIAHDVVVELGKPHDDASCIIFKWLA